MALSWVATIILALILSCLLTLTMQKCRNKGAKLPPGPLPLPFLGNLLQLRNGYNIPSFNKLREKYGPVFTMYMGPQLVVVLHGHDAVKEALVDQADDFSDRGEIFLLDQCFQGYGVPINPIFFLSRTVSNVISSMVFGSRFDYEDRDLLKLLQMMHEMTTELNMPWAQLYNIYHGVMRYLPGKHRRLYYLLEDLKEFIVSRVKANEASLDPHNPQSFIDCFLIKMHQDKDNPYMEFHFKNLVTTALGLFIAGIEPVGSILHCGLLLLLKYPEVQAKIQEEIDQVIGTHCIPSVDDRFQMPYTEAVIHEILRTKGTAFSLPRCVTQDTQFRGYLLPKSTNVLPLLGSVLRDPKYFRYPDAFYPQHFLDEQGHFKRNEAFVVFSSGKRICPGASMTHVELFLYFTSILQSLSLRSLMPLKDTDTQPFSSGMTNIVPTYELCFVERRAPPSG